MYVYLGIETNKQIKDMKTNIRTISYKGQEFTVWSDMMRRGTFATNSLGEEKALRSSGYLSNENSVKKAIKLMYSL